MLTGARFEMLDSDTVVVSCAGCLQLYLVTLHAMLWENVFLCCVVSVECMSHNLNSVWFFGLLRMLQMTVVEQPV